MAWFIEVTTKNKKKIVNAEFVMSIRPSEEGAEIETQYEVIEVQESYSDLKNLLGADYVGMGHEEAKS